MRNKVNEVQFIKVDWEKEVPKLIFWENHQLIKIPIPAEMKLDITDEKRCAGYFDVTINKYIPCDDSSSIGRHEMTCKLCKAKNKFFYCVKCNGSECSERNNAIIKYCSQPHYVYLAYFEKGIIKVGTAAAFRGRERLLEQGALYSYFIAKTPNGRIARNLESQIGHLEGVVTRVNRNHKIANSLLSTSKARMDFLLKEKVRICREKIKSEYYFDSPIVNDFSSYSERAIELMQPAVQIGLFDNDIIIEPKDLYTKNDGNIKCVHGAIGDLLFVETEKKVIKVIDGKEIKGNIVGIK